MDTVSSEREVQHSGNILDYMRKTTDSAVFIGIRGLSPVQPPMRFT